MDEQMQKNTQKKSNAILWAFLIVVVLAVAIGYFIYKAPKESASAETIKIGVVAPLSGDIAFLGEGVRDAMILANEKLGDTQYNYELIFEDDQADPKVAASAANKLIEVNKVDALASFGSSTGNVIAPIAEENKVVHIGIATDPNVAEGDYNFIHWTTPSEENRVFIAELQKRGIIKFGVFASNQPGAAAVISDMKKQLEDTDIEITTEQIFNVGETDFKSIIAKAKNSGSEIYLFIAFSPELEILARQTREAGITIPFTAIEAFDLTEQLDLFEGDWYVNAADPSGEFTEKFFEKTGKNPTLGSPNAYDIFNLIVAATEKNDKSEKPTSTEISNQLLNITDFYGALGKLNIDEDGIVQSNAVIRMIKNGEPITIEN